MNPLHKKCFIASGGVHLLLLVILIIGPAFLSSKSKSEDVPVLDFIPSILVDANAMGGGNRNAKPPPALKPAPQAPPQAQQAPPQAKPPEAEPPKPTVHVPRSDPDSFEPAKEPRHKPQISTTLVTRKTTPKKTVKTNSTETDNQVQEQQLADARHRAAKQLASAAQSIREGTSPATTIEYDGPGGGGPSYANYASFVKTIYENAWQAPDDTAKEDAVTKVSVTINSDGSVNSARISRPSGDSQVDRSVQRTLERVTFIAPFPDGAKDKQRTYIINFNLKAKRGLA